jgi:hypothetical protein
MKHLKIRIKILYPTLRLVVSAIKDAVIARTNKRPKRTDQDIMSIVKKDD